MSLFEAEKTVHIDAPLEKVWELVGDPANAPKWSPECRRVEWQEGARGPSVGAVFRGWNRIGVMRWSMPARVRTYEPPVEMGFATFLRKRDATAWRYRLATAGGGGTDLTISVETQETKVGLVDRFFKMTGRQRSLERNLERSLNRIKALVEG